MSAIYDFSIAYHINIIDFCKFLPPYISRLGVAACSSNMEHLAKLLEVGVEINPTSCAIVSPLLIAIMKGNDDIVAKLLVHGADPNCSGNVANCIYPTLLFVSLINPSILCLLLKFGLDVRQCISNLCVTHLSLPNGATIALRRQLSIKHLRRVFATLDVYSPQHVQIKSIHCYEIIPGNQQRELSNLLLTSTGMYAINIYI